MGSVIGGHAVTMRRLAHISCVATLALLLSAADGLQNRSAAAVNRPTDTLDSAIAKLVEGTFSSSPCVPDQRQPIGLWVFEEDKVPVAAAAARRLHEELLARLLTARPKCVDVLDSAGIGVIIDHLSRSGALERNGGSLIAALNDANQNVDLIAFPSLYSQGAKTVLALRVVERKSGRTLALTAPVVVPDKYLVQSPADQAVSLEAAVKTASKYFADNTPDLIVVRPMGVFFEDTGAQPAAGRYLMDHLIAELAKDTSNVLTGKVLKVRGLTIEPAPKSDGTVDAKDLEAGDNSSSYDLSGRYWIHGGAVDVRFAMKRGDGATLAWQGKIQIGDFKDMELRPASPAVAPQPTPQGAFAFQVTTPKGSTPIYRPGEELTLFIRLGQEASVYCFYVNSKGGVLTVLPNRFSGSDANANRFAAKVLHHLPDPDHDRFSFKFTNDTTGEEQVECFASTRDVRAELPQALFPDQIAPVPFLTLEQLRKLFADLKDTKISEASVTVTVAR
jgi:hypothetical protein